MIATIKKLIFGGKKPKAIRHEGLFLPNIRNNQDLSDNQSYLDSGKEQLSHVNSHLKFNEKINFLDFGCGQGRILNSFQYADFQIGKYIGIDTNEQSIAWCQKYLSDYPINSKFIHVPAKNERYNKKETSLSPIPIEDGTMDIIFLNSVFSHMLSDDIRYYLKEYNRVLSENGIVYLTAFVEENVPNEMENPPDYLGGSRGPLHRVRFEKNYFEKLVLESGLKIDNFYHQHVQRTKQSVVVLSKG